MSDLKGLSVDRELIKGVVHLARHKEFYGHIVQQFDKIFVSGDNPIQTAAVGRYPGDRFIKLYLNTDFFAGLFKDGGYDKGKTHMLGVLEHEIAHVVFGHLFVRFEDHTRGNVAKDLVVNGVLPADTLPGNYVIPEHYGFKRGKSAMWYYTHLRDNKKYQQQCASGQFGVGGALSHIMSSHKMWGDVENDIVAKEFMKDVVRKAKDLCGKNYGDIPGGILEQIEELLKREKSVVPWGKLLRMFVASCAESVLDYTVKRISRRYNVRPGTRKGDVLNLAVAVDTSGCFVPGTLIPMADGSLRRIDRVCARDDVVSSSFGGDQIVRKCTRVFKRETNELVEVEATKGFSFECTPCHRIFVVRPDFDIRLRLHKSDRSRRDKYYDMLKKSPVVEMRADELKNGDLIVVTNGTLSQMADDKKNLPPLCGSQSGSYVTRGDIDRADDFKKRGISYRKQRRDGMMRFYPAALARRKMVGLVSHLVSVPQRTSEEFCQLMGYFMGDGHVGVSTFVFTDENKARLETYRKLVKGVFGLEGVIKHWTRNRLVVNSKSMVLWIKDNFPTIVVRSRGRTIPEEWTGLPNNEVGALLRGLFDAEGFVGEHYVAFSNSSRELVGQIHLLLARLGIEASVRPTNIKDRVLDGHLIRGGHFWRLAVGGLANLRLFEQLVGFSCVTKMGRLKNVVDAITQEQNNDSYLYTKRQRLVMVKKITRRALDIPVTVYDLEIEGEHNYMANGVVVHNSISDTQLKLFFNEIRWIWKNGAVVTVFEADCQVCAEYKFKGKFTGNVHGRGGTDLEPVLKLVERKYDALIYFTDFYAPKVSKQYRIPILWVLTTELEKSEYPYPWGKHIKIEDGKAAAA